VILLYDIARDTYREACQASRAARQAEFRKDLPWFVSRRRSGIIMATKPRFYDATVTTGVDAVTALLNSGFMKIYSGAQPSLNGAVSGTLLATLDLAATAFGASSASAGTVTATAGTISNGTAGNTGTAGYFVLEKSNGTTIVASGTCDTSAADLNLNSTSIVSGAVVSCSSFTITQVQALNG
jgi:hypothetical protein